MTKIYLNSHRPNVRFETNTIRSTIFRNYAAQKKYLFTVVRAYTHVMSVTVGSTQPPTLSGTGNE